MICIAEKNILFIKKYKDKQDKMLEKWLWKQWLPKLEKKKSWKRDKNSGSDKIKLNKEEKIW